MKPVLKYRELCHKPEFAQLCPGGGKGGLAFILFQRLKIPLEYAKYLKWFDSWMFINGPFDAFC